MKLENQVVSLELAKKLKELGVPQESLFYWMLPNEGEWRDKFVELNPAYIEGENKYTELYDPTIQYGDPDHYWGIYGKPVAKVSAFTVAELFQMMPDGVRYGVQLVKGISQWHAELMHYGGMPYQRVQLISKKNAADTLAQMLIYLIENGLLDVKTLSV